MSLAPRTTIIIPTKDRRAFIHRSVTYYRREGFAGALYVLDGSLDPYWSTQCSTMNAWKLSIPQALCSAAAKVQTEFAVYAGDDDYLIPQALDELERALDAHPGHPSARGHALVVNMDGVYGVPQSWESYKLPVIEEETPEARLLAFIRHYAVGIFCLHRADTWKKMWERSHLMPEPAIGAEIAPCCISAAAGKMLRADIPMLVRQIHPARVHTASGRSMLETSDGIESFEKMVRAISENLGFDAWQNTREEVKSAFNRYLEGHIWERAGQRPPAAAAPTELLSPILASLSGRFDHASALA